MTFVALESLEAIVAAAARHGLTLVDAQLDQMGLDYLAVHARDPQGTRWIVRAPRRLDVAEAAHIEAQSLAAVAGKLPVAVPDWRIAAEVIAYPRLEGTPVVTLENGGPKWNGVDPSAPAHAFLNELGALLAALQSVPSDGFRTRTIAEEREDQRRIIAGSRELLDPPAHILERWTTWVEDDSLWPTYTALSHGDLHPGHMLLDDESRKLTGILDWTEARVGDPGIDLAMMLRCFGKPALEVIVEALVAHGGRTWQRAIDHAVERTSVYPAAAADWAKRANNEAVMGYAKAMLAEQLQSE